MKHVASSPGVLATELHRDAAFEPFFSKLVVDAFLHGLRNKEELGMAALFHAGGEPEIQALLGGRLERGVPRCLENNKLGWKQE